MQNLLLLGCNLATKTYERPFKNGVVITEKGHEREDVMVAEIHVHMERDSGRYLTRVWTCAVKWHSRHRNWLVASLILLTAVSITELGAWWETGSCHLTTQNTHNSSTIWSATCWWQVIITLIIFAYCAASKYEQLIFTRMDSNCFCWPVHVPVISAAVVREKGNKLCNGVWCHWCQWLHLKRLSLPLGELL